MRPVFLIAFVTGLLASFLNLHVEAAAPRANVIVILADDLGYGDLSCYGHPKFRTPNLDRMAAQGARMTQFNTPMPYCAPTRASLITGRYPFRNGLAANPTPDATPSSDALSLSAGEITLAQRFRQAGYATGMAGKWHLGHKKPESLPTHRGFDEYFGIPYSNDMRPVHLIEGDRVVEYPTVQATLTRRYTERALDFIGRNKDRPFFYYFAHAMPHKPLACSEEFYKKSGAGLYGDVLSELDWSVGRILDKLKSSGLDERTLVIFTSDNGPWFGGSTGGLRGMKGRTWEGGFRVPMIARWPGKIPPGRVVQQPGVTMDIFATALAAAGIDAPSDRVIDGKNLLPALSGQSDAPIHDAIFGHSGPRIATVREGRWKLHVLAVNDSRLKLTDGRWIDPRGPDGVTILAPHEQNQPTDHPGLRSGDPTPAMSLFDLEADPAEQRNVAAGHRDVVDRLKARYDAIAAEFPATAAPPTPTPTPR